MQEIVWTDRLWLVHKAGSQNGRAKEQKVAAWPFFRSWFAKPAPEIAKYFLWELFTEGPEAAAAACRGQTSEGVRPILAPD